MAKFKPGDIPNPNGRGKGSKNWNTLLRDELRKDAKPLIKKMKEKALDGDVGALQFLIGSILPKTKPSSECVDLPLLSEAETLTDKANAILNAVAAGELPPDIGSQLISNISNVARVIEIEDLAKRLDELEKALKS
ncbi:MAG: DUF5681 domain-containing protein [Oleiphilus sp.]